MARSHVTRLAVLQRAISFMDRHKAELGGVSESRPPVIIEESIAAIERHAGTQSFERTRSTSQTKVKHDLREKLRLLHMQPIAGICRMEIARGRRVAKVRVPPKRSDDADLLAAAAGMADVAAKYKDLLIANGPPRDFIKELNAATSALRDVLAARRGHRLAITRSTSAILLELRRG